MNFTHAPWKDEQLKTGLVNWMARNSTYAVLSDYTHQDKKWSSLEKIHDFNFLKLYCSKFFVRVASFLGFGSLVSYPCIQKLYKSKIYK
jgi:expansin (peptidoglycan-binding protein)